MNIAHALRAPLLAVVLLCGCAGEDPLAPPEIRLGRDECVECGMLIMEDRCSAARVIEVEGHWESQVFDDVGCLLDREREESAVVVERYFRDYRSSAWVASTEAAFLVTDAVRTPMASGIIALADRAGAEQMSRESGGRVLDYATLARARADAVRRQRSTDAHAGDTPAEPPP